MNAVVSALFMTVLKGAVNALAVIARRTANPYDDEIASLLQEILADPAQAVSKAKMFRTMTAHMQQVAANANQQDQEQPPTMGAEAGSEGSEGRTLRTKDPVTHPV